MLAIFTALTEKPDPREKSCFLQCVISINNFQYFMNMALCRYSICSSIFIVDKSKKRLLQKRSDHKCLLQWSDGYWCSSDPTPTDQTVRIVKHRLKATLVAQFAYLLDRLRSLLICIHISLCGPSNSFFVKKNTSIYNKPMHSNCPTSSSVLTFGPPSTLYNSCKVLSLDYKRCSVNML